MDPPTTRPLSSRRIVSADTAGLHSTHTDFIRDVSPSPVSPAPFSVRGNMGSRSGRSTRLASTRWNEEETEIVSHDELNLEIELAECVETKTVTTTTTTKRSYPPIHIRQSRPLQSLDIKEYPLAQKPTPPELQKFSYVMDGGHTVSLREAEKSTVMQKKRLSTSSFESPNRDESQETGPKMPLGAAPRKANESFSPHTMTNSGRTQPPSSRKRSHSTTSRKENVHRDANLSYTQGGDMSRRGRSEMLGRTGALFGPFPATPEASELNTPDQAAPAQNWSTLSSMNGRTSQSEQNISPTDYSSWTEAASPSSETLREPFNIAVATPPVAESDSEQFDAAELSSSISRDLRRAGRLLENAEGSTASLPSPRLSPTLAAAQLHSEQSVIRYEEDAITTNDSEDSSLVVHERSGIPVSGRNSMQAPNLLDVKAMIETFDTMSDEMKTFMMHQFLKRCPRKVLHNVANTVNPALMCDFLDRLPPELSYQILGFLNHKDLCRSAQVSKRWRNIIDSNETGWKELLDRDGFTLPDGELQRAIVEGWGWQDPFGPESCEKDISGRPEEHSRHRSFLLEGTAHSSSRPSKRKRGAGLPAERAKRRAISSRTKAPDLRKQSATLTDAEKVHKSEGPMTAASAAALAVPNPAIGLPSLRELHLFKSLYRRHAMMQRNWTTRDVKPLHMAFPAHPRFVITCLQFDDDKILTGSDDTYIHVYDTKTGALRKKLEGHEGGVWALQYQGNVLVSGSTDRSVRVWDIEKGLCTQVFHGHTSTVRCLQIVMPIPTGATTKDGKAVMVPEVPLIITGSRDSQLRVWKLPGQGAKRYLPGPGASDTDCPYFVRVLTGHTHSVRAIAAHGDTLVSGSYDFTVRVWRISDGETIHRLTGHTNKVYSVVLDKERNRCISGSMDNHVKIWSLESGACLYTLEGHSSLVGLLDLYDGRLVSAAADSTLRIWDPENGECKHTLTAHTAAITCFQHDDTKVISGSDRTLKMWNVKTGECVRDLLTDLSGVWQVRFDQRRCVAAVQRNNMTYIEILDFGASRDGVPSHRRGSRILIDGRSSSLGREEIAAAADLMTEEDHNLHRS